MCPACMASAALVVAGAISTGGLTALAARPLDSKSWAKRIWSKAPKEKEK